MGTDSFTYKVSDGTAESSSATVTISVTGPQVAAGGELPGDDLAPLTMEELRPIQDEAITRWVRAGLDADQAERLRSVPVSILDLLGAYLGLSNPDVVMVNDNAAGHGWFIDATPADDLEYVPGADGPAQRHMDLLTVVEHELGHVLGLLDQYERPDDLMYTTLAEGVRRQPTAENVAAAGAALQQASLAQSLPGEGTTAWPELCPLAVLPSGGQSLEVPAGPSPVVSPDSGTLDLFFALVADPQRQPEPWEIWTYAPLF